MDSSHSDKEMIFGNSDSTRTYAYTRNDVNINLISPRVNVMQVELFDGFVLGLTKKPSRIHRFFMKLAFGWKFTDLTVPSTKILHG